MKINVLFSIKTVKCTIRKAFVPLYIFASLVVFTATSLQKIQAQDICAGNFIEDTGLVVVEVESIELKDDWNFRNSPNGYTGLGFLEWKGGINITLQEAVCWNIKLK
ncbi:MAG: hypothetical protein GVY19_08845 [Bacteroidetes bacterium]|jgi:hypothetical protein|nr:hypothetical protein [Bacteroidota bacterium]